MAGDPPPLRPGPTYLERLLAQLPPETIPPPADAWAPAVYDKHDVRAFQALAAGVASKEQQQVVVRWLLYRGCRVYDVSFRPGGREGERATDFAEGRRFVGQQIVKLINMDIPE